MQPIRWGILSTGNIASQFARGLASLQDAELLAVGSRSQSSADTFGDTFQVPRRYASYEDLANDPDVDAVYIGTPHPFHKENTLLCLRAGKAVLCEKPFALNARDAAEMVAVSRERGVFLMEAMWTRFLPHMVQLRELVGSGAIGEPRMLNATFSFRTEVKPKHRLFDLALGGGALLDVGVYPVALAHMVFGAPSKIISQANVGETGVDEQDAMIFGYEGGQMALLSTAIRTSAPHDAILLGTKGHIRINNPWWSLSSLTLAVDGQPEQQIKPPTEGNGYNYEAAEVARCLRAGETESPTMPLDETLAIMATMDALRAQWGVRYPGE